MLEHEKKKPGLSTNRPSNNWALINTELCEKEAIFSHQRYIKGFLIFSHVLGISMFYLLLNYFKTAIFSIEIS